MKDKLTMSQEVGSDVLGLTAKIVSAHVGNNTISIEALPLLIRSVYTSLSTVGEVAIAPVALIPAVAVKKSVFADFIICLEDGKKLKMLKRHLKTSYNLTPEEYRSKWGLPSDYPMVAPSYASHRSTLAKKIGLGLKRTANQSEEEGIVAEPEPAVITVRARRARGSKG